MWLPSVKNQPVAGKRVFLRTDYDIPLDPIDTSRVEKSLPTIKYLLEQKAQIIIISHLGRPEGKIVPELSLKPVADYLEKCLRLKIKLVNRVDQAEQVNQEILLLENLRFYPEEEANDENFAKKLATLADLYVNEAFAASHRNHASIVGISKYLPSAFGFSFLEEIEVLSKVKENPARPVTLILGGAKEDKLEEVEKLAKWADWVLIGGRLPLANQKLKIKNQNDNSKIKIAELNSENKDINSDSIEIFKQLIMQSRTVVWAGPMGVYEEEKNAVGTREIAQAIVESGAFSVVGGGDTEAALTKLGFNGKMGYISSGGGAMLEMLANGSLPGIEAIKHGKSSY